MSAFLVLLWRDVKLATRSGGGAALALCFFALVATLVPLGIGADLKLLARVAGGILWVGAVLAALLSLDRLFQGDYDDGSLELIALAPLPLELTVLAKVMAHWLTTGLPLSLLAPLFGLMLNLDPGAAPALVATLLVGTPALTLIGAVGAALTVSLRRGGLLISVLVLPLAVPTLIFGVAAANAAIAGQSAFGAPFGFLAAISLLMLVLAPVAGAAALRLARE